MNLLEKEFFGIEHRIKSGNLNLQDIGDIVPASLMLHHVDGLMPIGCFYMNAWGCSNLGSSAEEVNALGESYYDKYFIAEELTLHRDGIAKYLMTGDFSTQFNFFQQVKLYGKKEYTWFYTVCKLMAFNGSKGSAQNLVFLSSPIQGIDNITERMHRVLELDKYIQDNYWKFNQLTKREKEVISQLANGKSNKQIADVLFLSNHTVSTHRKNIIRKLDCNSFADLMRFAIAFNLVDGQ
ncbi:LuxR C-terminal-related transcriptional regulator [Sphingobacterium kyonggiense]